MRFIVMAFATFALSACVIPIPTVGGHAETKEQVAKNVTALRTGIAVSLGGLHSLRCAAGRCYAATDVDQIFDAIANALPSGFEAATNGTTSEVLIVSLLRVQKKTSVTPHVMFFSTDL